MTATGGGRVPPHRFVVVVRHAVGADEKKLGDLVGDIAVLALFACLAQERDAGLRVLREPAPAHHHGRQHAHRFDVAGVGLAFERRRNLGLVDLDLLAVAQAVLDPLGRRRMACFRRFRDPALSRRVVPRHVPAVDQGEAEQQLVDAIAGDCALQHVVFSLAERTHHLQCALVLQAAERAFRGGGAEAGIGARRPDQEEQGRERPAQDANRAFPT